MTETMRMDGIYDLSTIWKLAGEIFPYFKERKIDWDAAYKEYLSRIFCIDSEKELHLLLAEFLNLLGDGHTDYRFPKELIMENGFLPFHLVFREGKWFIGETAEKIKEFLGTEILEINGIKIKELVKQCCRYIYHVNDYADPETLERILPFFLKDQRNKIQTSNAYGYFDLEKELPQMILLKESQNNSKKIEIQTYQEILYVRMDHFLNPHTAQEVLAALSPETNMDKKFAGVILDLRNNIGGMTAYAAKVAELFISGEFHACKKKTREIKGIDLASASQYVRMSEKKIEELTKDGLCDPEEVKRCLEMEKNQYYFTYIDSFGSPEQKALYHGPIVILISRNTISAAEDFAAMFRSAKRAVFMGTPTLGTTGTPLLKHLRLGGFIRICSVGYQLLDGTEFIGKGIMPDFLVEESWEDYRCQKDPVLKKALEYLKAD